MKTYSVKDLQGRYGVGEHTILAWIRSGELRGTNVARTVGGRPKWRVTEEAVAQFELARASGAPAPKASRRKKPTETVLNFY